jgi:hypothetical protein
MSEDKQKQELIEEIQRRIKYLISTPEISDDKKVTIAREFFQALEGGEEKVNEEVQ